MDIFQQTLRKHFYISLVFFALGLFFGLYYSINLLGYSIDSDMLLPSSVRSAHISLMLYGFVPLMLSFLPFLLLHKDLGDHPKALRYLELYAYFWYFFLVVMSVSLLMGVRRHLAFYDFHYSLNVILALSGLFYALALYHYIRAYEKKPLWVRVSLGVVVVAPFALLFLMNPVVGQVEATISGPHGDNTLGMSLALIPIYYLIFKLLSKNEFRARWHIFWIIPAFFYILSVAHRIFIGQLSYNEEWFAQWLTLLYIPLLYRWYRDADIPKHSKKLLLISIIAFLFVDVEGNILFIPSIRWLFHRNDLVVAHAHIAMGVGVLFMALSLYGDIVQKLTRSLFVPLFLFGMMLIFVPLTLNGFVQAGYLHVQTQLFWTVRTIGGIFIISSLFYLMMLPLKWSKDMLYHLGGFLSDGLGAVVLLLIGSWLYAELGWYFDKRYIYVVFAFMGATGIIHLLALLGRSQTAALATVVIRLSVSAVFLALFLAGKLGIVALLVGGYDLIYAAVYLTLLYKPNYLENYDV